MGSISSAQLQILITAVDNASGVLSQVSGELDGSSAKAADASTNWADVGKQMGAAAAAIAPVAAFFDEMAKDTVTNGADTQTAMDQAANIIGNVITQANSAGGATSGYATQVAFLTDKINGYK